uniref:Uncharacterized protein n=1 Tax=Pan troglodytes TaxID=9598 RepID=G2HJE8_PANTR|nr:hypothetical protein [Pan troglodytes]
MPGVETLKAPYSVCPGLLSQQLNRTGCHQSHPRMRVLKESHSVNVSVVQLPAVTHPISDLPIILVSLPVPVFCSYSSIPLLNIIMIIIR